MHKLLTLSDNPFVLLSPPEKTLYPYEQKFL